MRCILIGLMIILIIMLFKKGSERFVDDITPFPETYVINLNSHHNRLKHMDEQLKRLNIPYIRIGAVDAKSLQGTPLISNWPCLGKKERPGTKGIQLSNLKVFRHALANPGYSPYILMLEDDCVFPDNFKEILLQSIDKFKSALVISFDDRCYMKVNGYPRHGMSAILIKRDILPFLIKEMDPKTSQFMNNYESSHRNNDSYPTPGKCHHDVLFFNLLFNHNIITKCIPIVGSNIFKSSINVDNALWWHRDS